MASEDASKDALCQVEIGPMVLEKICKFLQCIFAISYLSPLPLEKGRDLHLNKPESLLTKDALCEVLVQIGPVVLEKKIFKICQYFSLFSREFYLFVI